MSSSEVLEHSQSASPSSKFQVPRMSMLKDIASDPAVSDLLDDADRAGEGAEDFDPSAPLTWEMTQNFHILLSDGTYWTVHSEQTPIPAKELQAVLARENKPLLGYWSLKQLIRADIVEDAEDVLIAELSSEGAQAHERRED